MYEPQSAILMLADCSADAVKSRGFWKIMHCECKYLCFVICGSWKEAQGHESFLCSLAGKSSHTRFGNRSAHQTLGGAPASTLDSFKYTLPAPLKIKFAQQDRGGQLSSACKAILQHPPRVSSDQILLLSNLTALLWCP